MGKQFTQFQLRNAIHQVLKHKEGDLIALKEEHEESLKELYLLTKPRNDLTSERWCGIRDEEEDESLEGFEDWKMSYLLGEGSSIKTLPLPKLPSLSPPSIATVFPDEPSTSYLQGDIPATHPSATPTVIDVPPPTAVDSPLTTAPVTGLRYIEPSPEPEATVNLAEIQPRLYVMRDFTPPPDLDIPEWMPMDNYRPAQEPVAPPELLMPLQSSYAASLPPLPPVPPSAVGSIARRRKRANSPQPDMYKLHASFSVNPLSSSLNRSTKCVLTCDWKVAMDELRHIRAMERIEARKDQCRWSLRQPKKARGLPVPKSHRDYMLEEMEWMRADFAEERRWKFVEAREFAYQIVEWHLASEEVRASMMVGGRGWGKFNDTSISGSSNRKREVEVEERQKAMAEDEDVEMLVGQGDLTDGEGEAGKVLESINEMKAIEEKVEEKAQMEEDLSGENDENEYNPTKLNQKIGVVGEDIDAEGEADEDAQSNIEGETVADGLVGLSEIDDAADDGDDREGSKPLSESTSKRDHVLPNGVVIDKRFASVNEVVLTRKPILDAPLSSATIDLNTLPKDSSEIPASSYSTQETDESLSLTNLFPELVVYSGPFPSENEKTHRRDEGGNSSHRMAHTSRIMDIEPLLVSTLQPAKNFRDGEWNLHDGPYFEELKGYAEVKPNVVASTSTLFNGVVTRPLESLRSSEIPKPSAHHLRPQLPWSSEEDECLLRLVSQFPFNWDLIADAFNTEMVFISVERRNAYECWERWYYNFGEGKDKPRPDLPVPTDSASAQTGQEVFGPQTGASTPGLPSAVPSSASSSRPLPSGGITVPSLPTPTGETPSEGGAPPPPGMSKRDRQAQKPKYEGTKRSIRHQAIYDAVKRMSRRREGARVKSIKDNAQKKVINVHESHIMTFPQITAATPWELVEAKYQRDVQIAQQRQQRAIQEQQRQLAMRQQQAMMNAQQQGQMRPPNMSNVPNAPSRAGPNGQLLPSTVQSQQQLLNAFAAVAAASAANRQGGNSPMQQGTPNIRPGLPVQGQSPQIQQQLIRQAQQMAVEQARSLRNQQQERVSNMHGNPHP
ncbi:hypothetical protein L204_100881 [Cryptococcus depauperatus]